MTEELDREINKYIENKDLNILINSYENILEEKMLYVYEDWVWQFQENPKFMDFILDKYPILNKIEDEEKLLDVFKIMVLDMLATVKGIKIG